MLAWKIAKRFLLNNKGQTLLVLAGIVIGVSVQIFIGSLIQGLQTNLVSKTVDSSPQIVIKADDPFELAVIDKLKSSSLNQVTQQAAVVSDIGILLKDDTKSSVFFKGMTVAGAQAIYQLNDKIISGRFPSTSDEIMLGVDRVNNQKLNINDQVEILINQQELKKFTIVGIYDLGVKTLNENWIFVDIDSAQQLFKLDKMITSYEIKVSDVFKADEIAQSMISDINDETIKVTNWKADNAQLLSGLTAQSVSSYMIQFFVIISVTLGIASVLAISVSQKQRQIGILKAMGLNNRQSSLIFLFQGLILGVIGGLFGVLAGVGMSYAFATFVKDAAGNSISPFFVNYQFLVFSFGIALASCMGSSLLPAIATSKLNPIEVIRNG